jgi:hypothetical protein
MWTTETSITSYNETSGNEWTNFKWGMPTLLLLQIERCRSSIFLCKRMDFFFFILSNPKRDLLAFLDSYHRTTRQLQSNHSNNQVNEETVDHHFISNDEDTDIENANLLERRMIGSKLKGVLFWLWQWNANSCFPPGPLFKNVIIFFFLQKLSSSTAARMTNNHAGKRYMFLLQKEYIDLQLET